MEYSPKIENALRQIDEVMKDLDLAGVVMLYDDTYGGHGVYKPYIKPTYSTLIDGRKPSFDLKDEKKARKTSMLFTTIAEMTATVFLIIEPYAIFLEKQMGITNDVTRVKGRTNLDN